MGVTISLAVYIVSEFKMVVGLGMYVGVCMYSVCVRVRACVMYIYNMKVTGRFRDHMECTPDKDSWIMLLFTVCMHNTLLSIFSCHPQG